jgi:8-amino-7-oxononanoate synthase
MNLEDRLTAELAEIAAAGLTRRRRVLESPCGRNAAVDGKKVLNFASNDYLGLAGNAEIAQALADGALHWGAGSGASHLVSGHLAPHEALEKEIAAFTGFPRALTFSTGYLANLAVTPTLAGRGDAVFADKLNHASLIDAMQLAKANGADVQRYPHNDVAALERLLAASSAKNKLIVTDAVFSMDGDLAPLPLLFDLAERYDAWLVIDDAHGFGVLGPHGGQPRPLQPAGIAAHPADGHAGQGGRGRRRLRRRLGKRHRIPAEQGPQLHLHHRRAAAVACALRKSLAIIARRRPARQPDGPHRPAARRAGRPAVVLLPSATAIQPLIVGDNEAAVALSKALWERGLWVPAIRPPTVPKGTARLRISVSAAHTAGDIATLIDTPSRNSHDAPLVFLPGWCLGRGPLNAAVDALNGQIFDLPGYGGAPLIADFDAAVDDIAARLQPGTRSPAGRSAPSWRWPSPPAIRTRSASCCSSPAPPPSSSATAGRTPCRRKCWPNSPPASPPMSRPCCRASSAASTAATPAAKEVTAELLTWPTRARPAPCSPPAWLAARRRPAPGTAARIAGADPAHPRRRRPADAARRRRSTGRR